MKLLTTGALPFFCVLGGGGGGGEDGHLFHGNKDHVFRGDILEYQKIFYFILGNTWTSQYISWEQGNRLLFIIYGSTELVNSRRLTLSSNETVTSNLGLKNFIFARWLLHLFKIRPMNHEHVEAYTFYLCIIISRSWNPPSIVIRRLLKYRV